MSAIEELIQRVAEIERKLANSVRHGPVTDVDAAKGLFRQEIGRDENGQPVKGPWIPYAQQAGALKVHTPPTVGQQMTSFSPSGDPQQAIGLPMTWSNQNTSPSQSPGENVITFGGATIKLDGSGLSISKGGVTVSITGGGVSITGGSVTHDSKNIGASHKHEGVEPGGGQTGTPA